MQYCEGHASAGVCSFQVMGFKCCGMCGKINHGSVQNEWLTDVVLCHFPCGVVERMI